MVEKPTVLVLGAGASYPYGFPTANALKARICEAFSNPDAIGTRLIGDNSDYSRDDLIAFREAFLKSGQPSIDAFLHRRPQFLGVGKLAIAYCLIDLEDERLLYQLNPERGGNWYEYLSQKMDTAFEEFANNRISIITFNYDRSLEHYLLTALVNLHGRDRDQCGATLAQIPFVHVYGQLGQRPYIEPGSRPYDPSRERFINVGRAAAGITLLHEKPADLRVVCQLMKEATTICFLGFSYHPMNLERLIADTAGSKRVFGTVRGLMGAEVNVVSRAVHKLTGSKPILENRDNLELLRHFLILG